MSLMVLIDVVDDDVENENNHSGSDINDDYNENDADDN